MFDRLIVSEPAGATHIRSRRNFFLVSTLVVAALALSAVVYDIFAEELSLGTDNFELTALVMPVDMPAAQPKPPSPRQPATNTLTASASQVPTRREIMSRPDEPTIVPTTTSTAAPTQLSRPYSDVQLGSHDSGPLDSGVRRDAGPVGNGPGGLSPSPQVAETTPDVDPPPVRRPEPPKNLPPKSLGVINGRATELPKPAYPAPALAVNAQGKVDVQVLIDENGHVVSAKAVSGNVLLRDAAERAARNARFTPTYLSNVAVKVTGVIVYNFTRS